MFVVHGLFAFALGNRRWAVVLACVSRVLEICPTYSQAFLQPSTHIFRSVLRFDSRHRRQRMDVLIDTGLPFDHTVTDPNF